MKPLRLVVGLFLAAVSSLVLGTLNPGSPALTPDLFLLPVADAARGGAPVLAMFAGVLAGLVEDEFFDPHHLLGLHAFTKVLTGYLLGTIGARTIVEKPLAVAGLLAGAVLFQNLVLVALLWLLFRTFTPPAPAALAFQALTTGALGAALFTLSRIPWRARREARRRRRLT